MNDELGVVLNYRDLYGRQPDIGLVKDLLSHFVVDDWLCQLSWLTVILGGTRNREPEFIKAFLNVLTPLEERARVDQWFREQGTRGRNVCVPTERDVEILIELAIVYAPEVASRRMSVPGDERSIFDALLAVTSLDRGTDVNLGNLTKDDSRLLALFSTLWLRSTCLNHIEVATRGYYLYEILKGDKRSAKSNKWADLFTRATGVDIDDYFSGGFGQLVILLAHVTEQGQALGRVALDPAQASHFPKLQKPLESFCRLRASDIATIKHDILRLEPLDDIGGFNLIPLRMHPLWRDGRGLRPLSLAGVAQSISEGIYHAVITASLEKRIPEKPQDVGSLFGYLYEREVVDLLQTKFGGMVCRSPVRVSDGNEAADALLMYPAGLVVFQIKGLHALAKEKYALRTPRTLDEFIRDTGLDKAVCQLASTVKCCRSGDVQGLPPRWAGIETPIQPVIVTFERIPQFSLLQAHIDRLTASVRVDKYVRRPILMSSEDIECVVSLPPVDDLWRVLSEYASLKSPSSFFNFLAGRRHADITVLDERRRRMIDALIQQLGLPSEDANAPNKTKT